MQRFGPLRSLCLGLGLAACLVGRVSAADESPAEPVLPPPAVLPGAPSAAVPAGPPAGADTALAGDEDAALESVENDAVDAVDAVDTGASDGAALGYADDARYGLAEAQVGPPPARRATRKRTLKRLPISGSLRAVYRLRTTGDESDNDLYEYLLVNIGDPDCPGWSGSLNGRSAQDLDGRTDSSGFYVYDSITDTFDSAITGQLYDAYVSYRPARGAVEMVRVGRQYLEGGELLHMDGVRVDFRAPCTDGHLTGSIYGGLPAHLYEDSPEGDFMAGFGVERGWESGLARFDFVHIEDETDYYGDTVNDIFTLTVRQRIGRVASVWAAYRHIDEHPTSLNAHFDAHFVRHDVSVRASFFGLFHRQNERVNEIDPYFAVVQELERYWTGALAVTKGIGDHFFVEGGVAVRRLFDDANEGTYNHSFERYYVTLSTDDWPCDKLLVSLTGELWESADSYESFAFDIEYRPTKKVRLQAGTDYSLYRFDLYADKERQSVQGYYVRVRVKTSELLRFHLHLRVDDDAFDTYVTLRTGFDLEF